MINWTEEEVSLKIKNSNFQIILLPVTYFKYILSCNTLTANFKFRLSNQHVTNFNFLFFRTSNSKDSYILTEKSPFTEFVSKCHIRLKSGVTIDGSTSELLKLKKT